MDFQLSSEFSRIQAIPHFTIFAKKSGLTRLWFQETLSTKSSCTVQKDLPKPKHEVYLRGVRPVPPCVLTEGPRRGTDFGGCLATAKPNFGQPESVSLLT